MSVRLVRHGLSMARAYRELEAPGLGGVVVFAGRVRPDRGPSGEVVALDYEVDLPLALRQLAEVERSARRRWGVARTVLWHRVGRVAVGEIAVIAGAGGGHRDEAFRAARFLIEELKRTVPIWKAERARSGRRRRRPPGRRAGQSAG